MELDEFKKELIKNSVKMEQILESQKVFTKDLEKTNDKLESLTQFIIEQKALKTEISNLEKRLNGLEQLRWFLLTIIISGIFGAVLRLIFK